MSMYLVFSAELLAKEKPRAWCTKNKRKHKIQVRPRRIFLEAPSRPMQLTPGDRD